MTTALLLLLAAALLAATHTAAAPIVAISRSGDPPKAHYRVLSFDMSFRSPPTAEEIEVGTTHKTTTREEGTGGSSIRPTTKTTSTTTQEAEDKDQLTTWSIAWYLTLLAAFIVFFILIGLTEIFCRHHARDVRWRSARREAAQTSHESTDQETEPPPPYDLFKPPSYSTLFPQDSMKFQQKGQEVTAPPPKQLVYVVSVHGGRGVS